MRIVGIRVYRIDLPYVGGTYAWGRGNALESARSTVVAVDTDAGISGFGEFCPCGENYMEAHSYGVEAAARLIAPALVGEDPRQVGRIERAMDRAVLGHGYAKAPFDAACWDLLGKSVGAPVWLLLGGTLNDGVPLYRVAPQDSVERTRSALEAYRAEGYRQFQVKAGADWRDDVERIRSTVPLIRAEERVYVDANRGWRPDDAVRVARATRDLDYVMEQPCGTYEACLRVRRRIDLPMKLDEIVTGIDAARRIVDDHAADAVALKVSNLGGLSKARRVRDFLVERQVPMVVEDSWGGEIATSAAVHLAASTPDDALLASTDLHNYNTRSTGRPGPRTAGGKMFASAAPGLGVEPDFEALGPLVARFGTP